MTTPLRVRSGRGIALMTAGFSIYALHGAAFYSLGIALPDLVKAFDSTETAIALSGSLHGGLTFGCCLVIGGMIDKFDCHPISMIGNLFLATGFILTGLCTEVYQLYLTNGIITGVGLSLQFMPIAITMQRLFSSRSRHAVTGFVISGIPAGIFISAPILRLLISTYGWRASYILFGTFFLNGIPLAMMLRTKSPLDTARGKISDNRQNMLDNVSSSKCTEEASSNSIISESDTNTRTENKDREGVRHCIVCINGTAAKRICRKHLNDMFDFELLRNIVYWFYLLALFMTGAGLQVPFIFLPSKALNCGLTGYEASLLVSCLGFSDALGRVLIGLMILRVAPMKAFLGSLLLISLINFLTPLLTSLPTLTVFAITFGFGHGWFQTAFYTAGAELVGAQALAKAMGPVFTMFAIAVSFSYPIAALLWERTGSVDTSFIYAGCTTILASILVTLALIKNKDTPHHPQLHHTTTVDL